MRWSGFEYLCRQDSHIRRGANPPIHFRRRKHESARSVAPLPTGRQSPARKVGASPSVRLDWRISRHLNYTAIYSHFFTGRFLKETRPVENVDYVSTWLTFSF